MGHSFLLKFIIKFNSVSICFGLQIIIMGWADTLLTHCVPFLLALIVVRKKKKKALTLANSDGFSFLSCYMT